MAMFKNSFYPNEKRINAWRKYNSYSSISGTVRETAKGLLFDVEICRNFEEMDCGSTVKTYLPNEMPDNYRVFFDIMKSNLHLVPIGYEMRINDDGTFTNELTH